MKTETTQIHFLSVVLVALASLDPNVTILAGKRASRRHSTTRLRVLVTILTYKILEVLSVCDREGA